MYRNCGQHHRVDDDGQDMLPGGLEVTAKKGPLQLHRVDKREKICYSVLLLQLNYSPIFLLDHEF